MSTTSFHNQEPSVKNDDHGFDPITSNLLGTSLEREILKHEIDLALQESLATDIAKEQLEARLYALMEIRKGKVEDEPSLLEAHCALTVRHSVLGPKVRLFRENSKFQQVYDWVGSLSMEPEYYHLVEYKGYVINPSNTIYSGAFNMVEVDRDNLDPSVKNYSASLNTLQDDNETLNNVDLEVSIVEKKLYPLRSIQKVNVQSEQTLCQDFSGMSNYELLQELRTVEVEHFNSNFVSAVVSRDNIYEDMIALFTKRNMCKHQVVLSFSDEEAVGDGITLDAFSAFFSSLYEKMEGEFQCVPSHNFDEDELRTIGKIITHAFLQCNVFPFQISKSSLIYFIGGSVSDAELLNTFLEFLPIKEASYINDFIRGEVNDIQPLVDILCEYKIPTNPTKENINQLLLKAAKSALIRLPSSSFQCLVEGMGLFWKNNSSHICSVYSMMVPTSCAIINCIQAIENTSHEQHLTTWLHRHIRNLTKSELNSFLRFVTGSSSFDPNMVIKVEYINQPQGHLRPCCKTCFKILYLPRQYESFTQLRENLCFYTNNSANWSLFDFDG